MLTVLNVAYPLASVGPGAVGGAEQILTALDAALVNANHQSLVIASERSEVRGELIPIPALAGRYDYDAICRTHQYCRAAMNQALSQHRVDLVHMHGVDFHAYLPPPGVPALATLHLPVSWYPSEIFRRSRPGLFLHCVSQTQSRDCPPCGHLLPAIRNGVEIPPLRRSPNPEYALAIGRICREKGFHLALEAARRANFPLVLAGQVFAYERHETYFREEVQPRLGGARVYVGPVSGEAKLNLYTRARCLVVSSTVPETCSLVALEALACGTPVVAFRIGALPEIVINGKTGFLVNDVDEMAHALGRFAEIDPQECRQFVREHFSLQRMTTRYLEIYRKCATSPGDHTIPGLLPQTAVLR